MIYSSLISSVINSLIKYLGFSENKIIEIKHKENFEESIKIVPKIKRCLKIKFISFFIVSFAFLILFWYYLACFGTLYKNTQLILLKDTLISFSLSLLYPLIIYLLPAFLRISLLKYPHCLFKFSNFFSYLNYLS